VRLSLDDFGTGYCSLSYLKHFPIDALKIDRAFVRDLTTDPDTATITTAIIAMARSLNKVVIAEGVETREQGDFLRQAGCSQLQGFLYGTPMSAAALEQLMVTTG
jgi:EAL domain-containing protein (putative c-di-GMP-specific phosphodiesterase class I)